MRIICGHFRLNTGACIGGRYSYTVGLQMKCVSVCLSSGGDEYNDFYT